MKGKIHTIKWHFNLNACYYYIQVDGKNKSKRYFEEDLVGGYMIWIIEIKRMI